MKIILFPTDFSENANDALEYLLQMHKGCKVHLHIIHVIDPRGYIIDSSISSTQILDQFRNAAEVEVKLIKESV